jgi:hypothetical protein
MAYGIVLMMDALGVSRYTVDECLEFLDKISNLETAIKVSFKKTFGFEKQISIFGDTVIICWPLEEKNGEKNYDLFDMISLEIMMLMHRALDNGLLFRGCISIGEYVTDKNIILGPAIFDAHDWYELTDWFGIILSPKARIWLDSMVKPESQIDKDHGLYPHGDRIVLYNVPLNHKMNEQNKKEFLTIAWPFFYKYMKKRKEIETTRSTFLKDLLKVSLSKEGEPKFQNSIDYFDWYNQNYPKKSKKIE